MENNELIKINDLVNKATRSNEDYKNAVSRINSYSVRGFEASISIFSQTLALEFTNRLTIELKSQQNVIPIVISEDLISKIYHIVLNDILPFLKTIPRYYLYIDSNVNAYTAEVTSIDHLTTIINKDVLELLTEFIVPKLVYLPYDDAVSARLNIDNSLSKSLTLIKDPTYNFITESISRIKNIKESALINSENLLPSNSKYNKAKKVYCLEKSNATFIDE